jgi:hypothetical protein
MFKYGLVVSNFAFVAYWTRGEKPIAKQTKQGINWPRWPFAMKMELNFVPENSDVREG